MSEAGNPERDPTDAIERVPADEPGAPRGTTADQAELSGRELAQEGTRIAVGALSLLGQGMTRILRESARASREAAGDHREGSMSPVATRRPTSVSAALPGAALGFFYRAQDAVWSGVDAGRAVVGPVANRIWDGPLAAPLRGRLERVVFELYERGVSEQASAQEQTAATLGETVNESMDGVMDRLDFNVIIEKLNLNQVINDLDLTDVIVHSTGGLAEKSLDTARAQAVGADSMVERVVSRILRRNADRLPKGPGIRAVAELPPGEDT
ncbi:MAG: hypothetical protein JJLCMIEE_00039 [Acidimicrobiales bacterium]|nr:MAG: hypothetical protein EDR02_00470 [Actinomycetota bacterium]MBV6507002.1 hypothetical protein [Acidimicrobiales bacterium]RIK05813.1 MAG: hypothetical protein DCC48_09095 [Acidobacteriota bacterium]